MLIAFSLFYFNYVIARVLARSNTCTCVRCKCLLSNGSVHSTDSSHLVGDCFVRFRCCRTPRHLRPGQVSTRLAMTESRRPYMPIKTLIMGAAGRDFHNFNTFFRGNKDYEVVAFTATQIPDIEGRLYPTELA